MIHTRVHKLMELGRRYQSRWPDADKLAEIFFNSLPQLPVFVLTEDVAEMAFSDEARDSVKALGEAGLADKLPFTEQLVEWHTNDETTFVLLMQADQRVVRFPPGNFPCDMISDFWSVAAAIIDGDRLLVQTGMLHVQTPRPDRPFFFGFATMIDEEPPAEVFGAYSVAATVATNAMLLGRNTVGIERERIDAPMKLNKQRKAHDRPLIPAHTVIKLSGSYAKYTRNGPRSLADARWHTRPHLRAGHIRQQPYGPRAAEEKVIKPIFIPPTVVNWHPGGEDVAPPVHVVRR
jgi:hypothetical protein